jgi:ABC-type siderophore export system fused ATPase/permease subunit
VIVISHDDHYYDGADRIVKLVDGRIEGPEPEFIPDHVSAEAGLAS